MMPFEPAEFRRTYMRLSRAFAGAVLFVMCAAAHPVSAQDSVMFRGSPAHTGEATASIKLPLAMSWRYVTGRPITGNNLASPIVVGTATQQPMVYFGARDILAALDLNTGEGKWFYPANGSIGLLGKTGTIRGTPVYADGIVYVVATDGNLYAINADTGALLWHVQAGGAINSSPILVDGTLYFGADDGGLYAVDAKTGEAVHPPAPLFQAQDSIVGSPAYADGMLFFISRDQSAYAIDLAKLMALQPGRSTARAVKWRYSMSVSGIMASPVVAGGYVYLVDGADLVCLTASRGRIRWRYSADRAITGTPAVTDQGIFFGTKNDDIRCINSQGRLVWTAKMAATAYSSPTVVRLEGMTHPSPEGPSAPPEPAYGVVVGSNRGFVYVFDTEPMPGTQDGKLLWDYRIRAQSLTATSTPTVGATTTQGLYANVMASPVVVNGAIYVLTDDGTLSCFRSDEADAAAPLVFGEMPARGSEMSGALPMWFAAYVYDEGSGINPDSLDFRLDGKTLNGFAYDEYRGLVYCRLGGKDTTSGASKRTVAEPMKPLADGRHTVTLQVADWKGNKEEWTWTFVVDNSLPPSRTRIETPSPQ